MEEVPATGSGHARRNEDIALDLMKFIAMTTGYGRTASSGVGFQCTGSAAKPEDYAAHLLVPGRGRSEEVGVVAAPLTKYSFDRSRRKKTAPWIGRGFVKSSEAIEASTLINGAACLFSPLFSRVVSQLFSWIFSWLPFSLQVSWPLSSSRFFWLPSFSLRACGRRLRHSEPAVRAWV